MNLKEIKRTDVLFATQITASVLSAIISLINLRRFLGQDGLLSRITIKEQLRRYYWIGIILIVLLTAGVIIYFRFVKHQIDQEDNSKIKEENVLNQNAAW